VVDLLANKAGAGRAERPPAWLHPAPRSAHAHRRRASPRGRPGRRSSLRAM